MIMQTRTKPNGWRFGVVAAAAIMAITATAAPAFAQTKSPREAESRMILAARQDPGTLDYVKSNLTALRLWIPANVVEPLVYFNKDGSVSPGVAESWEISDDKLTYTFKIREAKFSNGAPLTVADVIYSLETMQKSPVLQNSSAYAAVTAIEKVDDHTVKITLSRPSQNFWQGMGSTAALIQPEAAAETIATNPIGTGPYKLVSYTSNSTFEFAANPEYWGTAPSIKNVTVRIITDGTAGLNALEAGELDAIPVNTIDLWEQLGKRGLDKKFSLVTYPQIGEPTYAVLNQKLDPELRQTIAHTLDRQSYNDAFGAPWGAENTCTFALPNQSWYSPESAESCPYPYDFEGAMKTVAEKGYADTKLVYASLSDVPDLSLPADIMIPAMQAAGFNVERNAMDLARYSQLIFQGRPPEFDVTIMSGDADPTQWACADASKAGWSTYCSAEYTKTLDDADQSTSTADYDALMQKSADILRKDAVIVPLLAKKGVGLFHPDLKGFVEPRVAVAIEFAPLHW
jgi:peptide/nickel transport system substrate-binding protein